MIEAIQAAAVSAAQTTTSAAASSLSQPQATAYDIRQFAEAYQRAGGGSAPGSAEMTPGLSVVSSTPPIEGGRGFALALEKLNAGADNINAMSQVMSANSADLTPGEMMQMTMRCHQFLFTSELTSNVANRTSDGITQLFRQQS